jgi:hypothetical protein
MLTESGGDNGGQRIRGIAIREIVEALDGASRRALGRIVGGKTESKSYPAAIQVLADATSSAICSRLPVEEGAKLIALNCPEAIAV